MFLDFSARRFSIVMESMDMSLINLIESRNKVPFPIENLKLILYQILAGLGHIHKSGFFHRDIKPENILISKIKAPLSQLFKLGQILANRTQSNILNAHYSALVSDNYAKSQSSSSQASPLSTDPSASNSTSLTLWINEDNFLTESETYIVKLADFGLARNADCPDPYTSYVSTRWYRAPELLLRRGRYSYPIDIWAFGTMATEISTFKPLFPGSDESDQLIRQVNLLGYPGSCSNGGTWRSMPFLAQNIQLTIPKVEVCFHIFNWYNLFPSSFYEKQILTLLAVSKKL